MSFKHKFLKDGFFVVLSNLLEKGVFFLLFLLIARNYSVEEYGLMISAFALGNIVSSFFDFGFVFAFQRESAAGKPEFFERLPSALILRALCWVPYLVVISSASIGDDSNYLLLLLLATAVYVYGINNDMNAILNGKQKYRRVFQLLLISRGILLAFSAVFIYTRADLIPVMYVFVISGIVHTVLLLNELRIFGGPNNRFSAGHVKLMILAGAPFNLSYILNWIYDKVDILLVEKFLNLQAVALYAAAYSVYKLPQSLANGLITPLYSEFSKEFGELGRVILRKNLPRIMGVVILSLAFITTFLLFSEQIIVSLYGEKFRDSAPLLQLLSIGIPFLLLNNVTGVLLNAIRREKAATFSVFIAGVFNIVINVILLPVIGLKGAVYSTIITEGIILLIQILFLFSQRKNLT